MGDEWAHALNRGPGGRVGCRGRRGSACPAAGEWICSDVSLDVKVKMIKRHAGETWQLAEPSIWILGVNYCVFVLRGVGELMRQRGFVSSEMRGCPFLSYGRCPRGLGPENAELVVGVDVAGASSPTGGRETAPDSRRFLTVWSPDPRLPCRVAPRCGGTAREAPGGRAVRGRRHAWGPLGLRGHDGGGGHFGAEPVASWWWRRPQPRDHRFCGVNLGSSACCRSETRRPHDPPQRPAWRLRPARPPVFGLDA